MILKDKNNNDISDYIFSLEGIEFRQNIEGGIVIPELSFSTHLDYNLGDSFIVFDENEVSCLNCYITEKSFNYEKKLYEYRAKDVLTKMQDFNFFNTVGNIFYNMRVAFMGIEWPYNVLPSDFTLFENQMSFKQDCIPVMPFIKYCLMKAGIERTDIIIPDHETHIDGYYTAYLDNLSTDEARNVIKAPLSHLYMDISNYYFGSTDTFFEALNLVLKLLNLYIVFYDGKYIIKKQSTHIVPGDNEQFDRNDEVIALYDHFETEINEQKIVFPSRIGKGSIDDDASKVTFGVFYRITIDNSPTLEWVQDQYDGRFYAMITTNDNTLVYYDLDLNGVNSVFTANPTKTPEVILSDSSDFDYIKYRYNLYMSFKRFGKSGLENKLKTTIKTALTSSYWTDTSNDPLAITIDIESKTKTLEVII